MNNGHKQLLPVAVQAAWCSILIQVAINSFIFICLGPKVCCAE